MSDDSKSKDKVRKTVCPVTREQFTASAKPLKISINEALMLANVKEFSTGSFGWSLNGKTVIDVGGTPVTVQIGLNLTVVGSKGAEKEAE